MAQRVTHSARITGPVSYISAAGRRAQIPLGPCLVEELDGEAADIVWGPAGERSALLHRQDVQAAEESGHLVLLD